MPQAQGAVEALARALFIETPVKTPVKTRLAKRNPLRMKTGAALARPSQHAAPAQAALRFLRRQGASALSANHEKPCARASDKPLLLIVGNEPRTALLVARILAHECRIQTLRCGARILDYARCPDQRPDLILLHVMGPASNGLEVCRQLKADQATRSIPVMLINDRNNSADEALALRLGAVDYVTHPFHLDVFEARIRNQIQLKLRNDQLEHFANQDSLTDIANRRCFEMMLDAEWRRAMRERQPLSLVMVDVDRFKHFNDLYGHREGDHCLRRVAKAMAQALTRPGDLLARYGGEEFAAILPRTDQPGARCIGERLRDAVRDLHIPQQRPDGIRQVTISVGCASVYPNPGLSCYSLLQHADEQLYLAKHAGRNCVR
jgi:diguanylate cyclase (GGDEF)-like protein